MSNETLTPTPPLVKTHTNYSTPVENQSSNSKEEIIEYQSSNSKEEIIELPFNRVYPILNVAYVWDLKKKYR